MKDWPCTWDFKSTSCGYSGGDIDCDKTIEACRAKGNENNFNGTPRTVDWLAVPTNRKPVLSITPEGDLIWKGFTIESDEELRKAMRELALALAHPVHTTPPKINVKSVWEGERIGTAQYREVLRVEQEEDGSFTAVIELVER